MEATQKTKAGKAGKSRRKKWWIFALVAGVIALILLWPRGQRNVKPQTAAEYVTAEVTRRDIVSAITGSGTLEAADYYSVSTLVEGEVLTAPFEEGDVVEKDSVLYTIDTSSISANLEQAEISYRQSKRSYDKKLESREDLQVKTDVQGRVAELNVKVGDEVSPGQTVAVVRDTDHMRLRVAFPADEAATFTKGQAATVTLDSTFETLSGTICELSGLDTVLSGNRIVREVTIEVQNPGGLSTTQTATATVGASQSVSAGTFSHAEEGVVTANVKGKVSELRCSEGDRVEKNAVILVLQSDTLEDEIQSAQDSLRNAELSLESRYDQLDKYTIRSPISGTIVDKNYKAGETTKANQALCTIYDLSYLTMTLNVDELDITNIEAGQKVSLTADAVEGKTYEGVVTKVSVAGTSSNGVATYPVTIRIDETDGLRPGMTVDATITLSGAENALAIPAAALQRGNTVLVTKDSPSAANGKTPENENAADYVSVQVTIGESDDDYIEIVSGLQDGDTIAYLPRTQGSTNDMEEWGPWGAAGGMQGPPSNMSGGMSGGMPSGMSGGMPGGQGGSRP